MLQTPSEADVIERLIHWAELQPAIRALLLYSSRADPAAPVDLFSDYDLLLAVTDIHPFHTDTGWLEEYGEVLVVFRNPIDQKHGFACFGYITHYRDGVKIDYGFYPVEFLRWAAQQPHLPDDLDHGYRVLLDKDHLTDGLPLPTCTAHIVHPPAEDEYRAVVEEFFNDALYVAKNLWRDNLFAVKLSLDHIMKYHCLGKMLIWRAASRPDQQEKPGTIDTRVKPHVEPGQWAELEGTYVGADLEANWEALFGTVQLFRSVAREVAGYLGYTYPAELDQGVSERLKAVKNLKQQLNAEDL